MNALDFSEFKSKTRSHTDLKEGDGITLAFLEKFMKYFANQSIGLDLSDVNFLVANEGQQRHADEQTFRELFELILDSINQERNMFYDFQDSYSFVDQMPRMSPLQIKQRSSDPDHGE